MTIQELKGTVYTIECLTKDEQKRIEQLLKDNGYRAFLGELLDDRVKKYLTVYEDLDVCRTEGKKESSIPIYKSTEITTVNNIQTLKRKRLVELHNQFTCQTWKENIVEILDLAGPLATDDTDIAIPQAKIDLLIRQGSKDQKDASGLKLTKLKVGDWVCIIQESHSKGCVFQLTEDSFQNVYEGYDISYRYSSWSSPDQVRLATQDEIDQVSCPYKDGELILVYMNEAWHLRYSNGKMCNEKAIIYNNQNSNGLTSVVKYHQKATGIELPPNPCK